ncbi:stalk domain-containing protein [Acetivibrio cellulolyticus]|uniref:stalk domain-containing protein n=1 Tax=Acetivibrio cellulolyticus TaxID=35830 RepID=UPI0001E2CC63|nr:stalk domain-containing protein [Acetivibrio cellulolyticus]
MKGLKFTRKFLAVFVLLVYVVMIQPMSAFSSDYSSIISSRLKNAIVLCIGTPKAYVNNVETVIDNQNTDIMPVIVNGRSLVPVRFISEKLGAQINWNASTSTATILYGDQTASITLNSSKFSLNNSTYNLDAPASSIGGRLYLPLRTMVEKIMNKNILYYDGVIIVSDVKDLFNINAEKEMLKQVKYLFYETILESRVICNNRLKLDIPVAFSNATIPPSTDKSTVIDVLWQNNIDGSIIQVIHTDVSITNKQVGQYKNEILNNIIASLNENFESTKWIENKLYSVNGINVLRSDGIIKSPDNDIPLYMSNAYFSLGGKEYSVMFMCDSNEIYLWKNALNRMINSIRIGKFTPSAASSNEIHPPLLIPGDSSQTNGVPSSTPSPEINGIALDLKPDNSKQSAEFNRSTINPEKPIIYITAKNSKTLYSINYQTKEVLYKTFEKTPEALRYYNNKLYVSLTQGHQSNGGKAGDIAAVDPNTLNVLDTYYLDFDPFDFVVGHDGLLYITGGSDQWTDLKSYDTSTKTMGNNSSIRMGSYIELHPVYDRLYTIDTNVSPIDYKMYDYTDGVFTNSYDSPYHGDYKMSPYFKISPDGKYLFNSAGTIFSSNVSKDQDVKFVYNLGKTFSDIEFNLDTNNFYTASGSTITAYDYGTFSAAKTYTTTGSIQRMFLRDGAFYCVSISDSIKNRCYIEKVDANITDTATVSPVKTSASNSIKFTGAINNAIYDKVRNKIYAIDSALNNLFIVDNNSYTIESTIKLLYKPSNLTLSEDNSKIYIANLDKDTLITEVDIDNKKITRNLSYSNNYYDDNSNLKIKTSGDKLFVTSGEWSPKLLVFDTASFTESKLSKMIESVGDFYISKDGRTIYTWYQFGWSSGNAGSNIFKYNINGDTITKEAQTNFSYSDFSRDPLDTPILVLEDKGIVICKTKVFSTSTLQSTGVMTFDENIYMVNPDSTQAIGKTKVYNIGTRSVEAQLTKSQCTPLFYDNQGILNALSGNSLVRNVLQ